MNDQKKLHRMIQNYAFARQETALYLDTHPRCRNALQYYARLREKLMEAARMYEEHYGQLTIFGGTCQDSWKWVEEAWPWEADFMQKGE